MDFKEVIEGLIKNNNKTKTWLAEKMGYVKATGVTQMLSRNNTTVDTLLRICDIFDYEITIQPKRRAGARPAGQYIITSTGKAEAKEESK